MNRPKVLVIIDDAAETGDTLPPHYRVIEAGSRPVVAVPEYSREFLENGKPLACVCHGVEILALAGIVQGLRMATVANCKFDLEVCGGIYVNEPCVIDRHMVSGRTYHDSGHFLGSWIKTLDAAAQKVSR